MSAQPALLQRSLSEHKAMARFVKKGQLAPAIEMLQGHINRTRDAHSRLPALRDKGRTGKRLQESVGDRERTQPHQN